MICYPLKIAKSYYGRKLSAADENFTVYMLSTEDSNFYCSIFYLLKIAQLQQFIFAEYVQLLKFNGVIF